MPVMCCRIGMEEEIYKYHQPCLSLLFAKGYHNRDVCVKENPAVRRPLRTLPNQNSANPPLNFPAANFLLAAHFGTCLSRALILIRGPNIPPSLNRK